MTGLEVALLFGLGILLITVMYLAQKLQRLHRRARHLKHLIQKLEGVQEKKIIYDDKGIVHKDPIVAESPGEGDPTGEGEG